MFEVISNTIKRTFSASKKIIKDPIPTKCQELTTGIKINPNTNNPDKAFDLGKINKVPCNHLPLDLPIYDNKIRFVCISDTHSKIDRMNHEIPRGDVLIHAGDFTNAGSIDDVTNFSKFLQILNEKFTYKVVIAGNHELSFEKDCLISSFRKKISSNEQDPRNFLKNCIYLEDSIVELFGIKIYGAPWQPTFGGWAFNIDRGEPILKKWNQIPDNCDILITHGPPLGFGDIVKGGYHVGCCELLSTVQERVRPKYHIFGHIHEDHGIWSDGQTTFINASTCTIRYIPSNPPIIFDLDLPEGTKKEDFITYQ